MTARSAWWLRLITVLTVAVSCLVAAGCANLPDSSQPQALGPLEPEPTRKGPPPPSPGRDQDLLLRDFLQATADPTDGHLAARQYMTPPAATQWQDTGPQVIVERADTLRESRTENEATYVLRARRVGELAADGSYRSAEGIVEHKIEMTRVGGQWRIDELPDGVVMEYSAFTQSYRRHTLYFVTPDGTHMVPDLRWLAVPPDQLAEQLVSLLIAGPRPDIAPVVRNYLHAPIAVRGGLTKANGDPVGVGVGLGGVRIDFTGIGELPDRDRKAFAAQVVYTLSASDVLGPYMLLRDGRPLDQRYAGSGWSAEDLGQLSTALEPADQAGLHALRDGALVEVVDDAEPRPVPGGFGALHNLQSAALSPDGNFYAGVADTGDPPRTLTVASSGGDAFGFATGASITRPSWAGDGSAAWAVIDGTQVVRAVTNRETGTVARQDVDTAELFGAGSGLQAPITEFRISRSGVRAALVAAGKVYVATVLRRPDGSYALIRPRATAVELSTVATSVDWYNEETIVVATAGTVDPVRTVKIDGSEVSSLGGRNLTPPVRQVAASADHQYVADSRAVLEFTRTPEGDPYWREVPSLGSDAVPVLPG